MVASDPGDTSAEFRHGCLVQLIANNFVPQLAVLHEQAGVGAPGGARAVSAGHLERAAGYTRGDAARSLVPRGQPLCLGHAA